MVCPEQLYAGVQAMVTVPKVLLQAAVPPVPVHEALYVVDTEGETDVLPDDALPVEKLSPVQEVAFVDDQVSVLLSPLVIVVGDADTVHDGATAHDAYVYVPLSVPLLQLRLSDIQEDPAGTVLASYAVTLDPWLTVLPSKVQFAGALTESV